MAVDVTGRLIEMISGVPVDRFVAENVTGPLKKTLIARRRSKVLPTDALGVGRTVIELR